MLQEHSILYVVPKKYFRLSALATAALLLVANAAWGQASSGGTVKRKNETAVKLLSTIPVPPTADAVSTAGALYSYDRR